VSDEHKKTELVCTKVTERIAIDLMRAAALDDRSVSAYLFVLILRDLYGRSVKWMELDEQATKSTK